MRAAVFDEFRKPLSIREVPDPSPGAGGVVIEVKATGLCRSDWHGWMGHDTDIKLPHVAGTRADGGHRLRRQGRPSLEGWDRVTLPFVGGCGECPRVPFGKPPRSATDNSSPGSLTGVRSRKYVAVEYADVNAVRLPDEMDFVTAASLGCRFATSFRAIVDQGRISAGQWVAVHGCGGVGLSAVMIASAAGANVVAVDIADDKLEIARSLGAAATLNASGSKDVVEEIMEITGGGAHVSVDALGSPSTCFNSIACLRKRGRHVQVGLMLGEHSHPAIPMDKVIARELELVGSHGIQAYRYPALFEMIRAKKLRPELLVGKTISLDEALVELTEMDSFKGTGVTVIDRFD